MTKKELENFNKKLVTEKAELLEQLGKIGKQDPSSSKGWGANSGGIKIDTADDNEVADKFEELEDNTGIVNQLDSQLIEVDAALDRIAKGTYGICQTCGKPIEIERLEANPAARVSLKHGH
jgi:DnaK suppressor protein